MEKKIIKKLSKIGEWLKSGDEPIIDLSGLTEKERESVLKAVMK